MPHTVCKVPSFQVDIFDHDWFDYLDEHPGKPFQQALLSLYGLAASTQYKRTGTLITIAKAKKRKQEITSG